MLAALLMALASLVLGDLVAGASSVAASLLHPAEVHGSAAKAARLPSSHLHSARALLASRQHELASRCAASGTNRATCGQDRSEAFFSG
jgi:hypothetical protein